MEKKYDWKQIQEDYNRGLSQRELTEKYGVSILHSVQEQKLCV
jgi:Trp operon repressor